MEEVSGEDKVNRHPGLIFLVTQLPLQSPALVVFTRLHKMPLVNYSLSVLLVEKKKKKPTSNKVKPMWQKVESLDILYQNSIMPIK